MEHLFGENDEFDIVKVDTTFSNLNQKYGDISLEVQNANVLALPVNDRYAQPDNAQDKKTFHAGIGDIYDYFSKEKKLIFEVYADDDDINHLSLHADDFWIGTFIITSVTIPIFVNLLSNYIYDKLKAKNEDNVSIEVIVDSGKKKSTAIRYRGKVDNFDRAIDAIKKLDE